jgi:CopG antitoxin of type II toxin-antitoxin system
MPKNKSKKLPKFSSLDGLVEFVGTHDMGDYWDQLQEAHFDVDLKRKVQLVPIDSELAGQIQRVAHSKQTFYAPGFPTCTDTRHNTRINA